MWKLLGSVPPLELLEARLEVHHAAQWIARATRAYCQPEADDSHTSLSWDSDAQALMGRPLQSDLVLGLRLEDLTVLAVSNRVTEQFSLFGQTENAVGDWMVQLVKRHDLDPHKLYDPGPYTLAHHYLDSGGQYGMAAKEGIEELAKYYDNISAILEAISGAYPQASPVRCWPHYFDIATLLSFEQAGKSERATIGVGCSPGDASYPQPYFYISLWPHPSPKNLPPVIEPSFWHLEGFTALILRSVDLVSDVKSEQQHSQVKTILEQGVKKSMTLLALDERG